MASIPIRSGAHSPISRAAPLIFAVLQILTPILPALGIGEPIGDQSASARTLITPAGWAFSIWGALYTGSLLYALFQALPAQRDRPLHGDLRWPAAGAFFGNALWALYTQSYGLSLISVAIILFTLACLLKIFRILATWPAPFSTGERWCAVLPLSALASWLTAASIVNVAAALRFHGVEGGGAAPMIGAAVLSVGGIIAAAALVSGRGNPPYALVFLWALAAIYAAGGQRESAIAIGVGIAAILVVGATLLGLMQGGTAHWFGRRGRR